MIADWMRISPLLSEEERELQLRVRAFLKEKARPLINEAHRNEAFPKALIRAFGEQGFLGANIELPERPAINDVAYGLLLQECERVDSGLRSFCSVQGSLVMYAINTFGSEEQKTEWLPRLASGEAIGCFGLTESEAGSDPGSMKTKATTTATGYELQGSKMWITNGHIADVAVVWARLDHKEIRGFLLDRSQFQAKPMKGKWSLRVSETSELYFDRVQLPQEARLPKASGLKAPLSCLSQARFGIVFGVIGAAEECFETALAYSKTREIFQKPLAQFQLVQAKFAEMGQKLTLAHLLALHLGRLKEKNELRPDHISLGKLHNCKIALEIARTSRDILGANGIMEEYPIMRHLMNLETVNTYEGTEDVHRLVVGQTLTGFSAFR